MSTVNQTITKEVTKTKIFHENYAGNLELEEDIILELNDFPHILQFIRKCQCRIKQQDSLIHKLQQKIVQLKEKQSCKLRKSFTDSETQTNFCDEDKSGNEILKNWNSIAKEDGTSLVEQIKEVAELAVQQTGFVYEETSGLYYDYNTGYYYDTKLGLYYDGNTGIYYYYDEESKSYKFHSQTNIETTVDQNKEIQGSAKRKADKSNKKKGSKHKITRANEHCENPEEGECSDSNSNCSNEIESNQSISDKSDDEDEIDLAKTYPPCMRIVVKETNLLKLKLGTLFLIPYTGGSIGREGNHNVLIQDINISKHHAKFQYNEEKKLYEIIDLGSRNGTILNNTRLSVAKQESDPHEVIHGSIVQVGSTKLLCHIHRGYETCGNCEPGLLQSINLTIEDTTLSKIQQHKTELRRLKTKFGVISNNNVSASQVALGYQDRAEARRLCNGSSDQYAKTQQSSLETSIAKDNKGFKLLSSMGWSEGQSLGKEGGGLIEPIPLVQNHSKSGFGFMDSNFTTLEEGSFTKKKQEMSQKMQERYNNISN